MTEIRVAFFAHAANLTGASRSLIDLTNELKKRNVVPIVFLPKHGIIEDELKKSQTRYYILNYQSWVHSCRKKKTISKRIKHVIKEIINFFLLKKATKILKKERVDLVHSNSVSFGFGGEVAHRMNLPHIWHIREFMEEDQHITFYDKRKAYCLLQNAVSVIAISDVISKKFSKLLNRRIDTVYNGVPIERYAIPDKQIFLNSKLELMIVGRIIDTKGQLEAIQAIEQLKGDFPNVHLLVIGNGTGDGYAEMLHDYVVQHSLGQWVEFLPFQSDLSSYSQMCDIQLVCSSNEAFGRVTVEGMLSHALVIGADAGCTSYLLNDGETGLLYECANAHELATKIRYAITHVDQMREIASRGYRFAYSTFSIENTANGVLKLYQNALK